MKKMKTERALKIFLILTGVIGILSPLLFPWLGLSLAGISKGFYWQFLTYLFVEPTASNNFASLLHLAFNLFLLWTFGGALIQRSHAGMFFALFFSAGLVASLLGFGLMQLIHWPGLLAGNSPALYAILIAWCLLNPHAKLLLFFSLPCKATWLLLGLIGANLIIDLTNGLWVPFLSYSSACLYAYLFSLIVWKAESSLPYLKHFERFTLRMAEKIRHLFVKRKGFRHSKIFDFKSGEPILTDDQFMDAMLARIARYGEDALSPKERERMAKISARKRR
jgi:rhomboid protease GluP